MLPLTNILITQVSHVYKLVYIQLKMRPINVLWGPIDLEERKKSSCLKRSKFCSFSGTRTNMGHKALSVENLAVYIPCET